MDKQAHLAHSLTTFLLRIIRLRHSKMSKVTSVHIFYSESRTYVSSHRRCAICDKEANAVGECLVDQRTGQAALWHTFSSSLGTVSETEANK